MVCSSCEKKQKKLATPSLDKVYRPGSRSDGNYSSVSSQNKIGNRIGVNKALANYKVKKTEAKGLLKCKMCKKTVNDGGVFCTACAYLQGKCHLCGKTVVSTEKGVNMLVGRGIAATDGPGGMTLQYTAGAANQFQGEEQKTFMENQFKYIDKYKKELNKGLPKSDGAK